MQSMTIVFILAEFRLPIKNNREEKALICIRMTYLLVENLTCTLCYPLYLTIEFFTTHSECLEYWSFKGNHNNV